MKDTLTIPGAVDLHVHLRQPGTNNAETIASGTRAALHGGYAAVCDMPNNPGQPTWTQERLSEKQKIIRKSAYLPVGTYAGAQPESDNLAELAIMAETSIGLKLYGAPTTGNDKDYQAADFSKIVKTWHESAPDKPVMLHAGQGNLAGFINLVAKKYQHHLHVCHVNSSAEVALVTKAKKQGLPISCGVTPHHLLKTSHDEKSEGWFARMQPPLVPQTEAEKLLELLAAGDIDVIETDHAPHSLQDKWAAENEAGSCYGVPGIEFAIPLLLYQVKQGRLSLERLVEVTSTRPAEIIGIKLLPKTKVTWRTETYRIGDRLPEGHSRSGWTPYLDKLAAGKVEKVVINGQTVFHTGTAKRAGRVLASGDSL